MFFTSEITPNREFGLVAGSIILRRRIDAPVGSFLTGFNLAGGYESRSRNRPVEAPGELAGLLIRVGERSLVGLNRFPLGQVARSLDDIGKTR